MVKGNPKSSATSATRKKHARRTVVQDQAEDSGPRPKEKKGKGKEKGKNKEPRQKMYIPPVKPAPPQPDPLDTMGLAHTLPPELLVVLRSLGKKAEVTKIRALEELQSSWADKYKNGETEALADVLVEMLPVWFHHVPSLFLHSSRRIRALTTAFHASLLQISPVRDQMLLFLRESASTSQIESILGTWCMAAHDVDRLVYNIASKSWNDITIVTADTQAQGLLRLENGLLEPIISFIQNAALNPLGVYTYLNPAPPIAPPPPIHKRSGGRPSPAPVRKGEEQSSRSKTDEIEESEPDKKARIRCGAIGAIRWMLDTSPDSFQYLTAILSNPALWSALCSTDDCPFVELESFGYSQPVVRKSAWLLLQSTLKLPKDHVLSLLPTLSSAVLRSAWTDTDTTVHSVMWQPLLIFLRDYPSCWSIDGAKGVESEDAENEERSNDESDVQGEPTRPSPYYSSSLAYREFLRFLESGCSGSPLQGYPTVLVILSTIPRSMLINPLFPPSELFTAMWAAVDSRSLTSLQRSATSAAFLSSLVECVVFLARRLFNEKGESEVAAAEDSEMVSRRVIEEQIGSVWDSLCSNRLKVEETTSSDVLAKMLVSLHNGNMVLFATAWETIAQRVKESRDVNSLFVAMLLKALYNQSARKFALESSVISLARTVVKQSVEDIRNDFASVEHAIRPIKGLSFLVDILNTLRGELFMDVEIMKTIDYLLDEHGFLLLEHSPRFIQAYLAARNNEGQTSKVWHTLLSTVVQQPEKGLVLMTPVLAAARKGRLPSHLRPRTDELDTLILKRVVDAMEGSLKESDVLLIEQVLHVADYILSSQGLVSIHHALFSTFNHQIQSMLWEGKGTSSVNLNSLLHLFETILEDAPRDSPSKELDTAIVNIFVLAYLLPECCSGDNTQNFQYARKLWTNCLQRGTEIQRGSVITKLKKRLRTLMCMTETRLTPEDVAKAASEHIVRLHLGLVADLLPTSEEYEDMLTNLSQDVIHPSLAVIDPLIPPGEENMALTPECDARGYSQYARAVCGLILVLSENRQEAKRNIWALKHILSFVVYASDLQSYPSGRSPLFTSEVLSDYFDEVMTKATQITAYLLTLSFEDGWRQNMLNAITKNATLDESKNALSKLVAELIKDAKETDGSRAARILKMVLQHVLDDVDKNEADHWLILAKQLEHNAPQISMTITSAIIECAPEPQRLDRYRNELAASLLGIPAHRANTDGLLALRKLAAAAPDPDSTIVFLPQQRAVNVVKACQQWISSDEDIDEEVESVMLLVFLHLAPILDTVPGSHWEFTFDVIESNLESSDIKDDTTFVALARALRLIIVVEELAKTNKPFSEGWQPRRVQILRTVRDMAMVKLDAVGISVPRSICRELILTVVQDLPSSLLDLETLPKMSHLLVGSSVEVKKMAYHLLSTAARRRTEHLVIEAGVDVEATVKIDLPNELIAVLQTDLNMGDFEGLWDEQNVLGCFLGWMLVFDSFQDASLKVKLSYVDQLRGLDLISNEFMPSILNVLRLSEGLTKAFKLDMWSVDEYHVELYEQGTPFSIPVLAAHLYYRALLTVPSLIHNWVLDCKDRQLSSAVINYTSTHFSPVIIQAELAHTKSAEVTSDLVDENFKVKVASSTNEVVAAYAVDEHQLEIKLKIPGDWPLHKIEVKDVKRVGVDEHRWRAWILAVQQSIWSHNGRILDGLGLFKKNVTLHFEGQTECAICYSIISPMDGSLPKKPCKTCRNRFHAGCLYKWFNTSHSSSCPLCRSDII
ncbi:hypothetical protein AX15_005604 [Amanita polypyramis BW_CC]|nr:hypothetical protein AX15_005604 [Amanita polypyramis BW_CC]